VTDIVRDLQIIHFVRHGEGFHNVAGKNDYSQYKRWDLEDANLTELGWQQVSTKPLNSKCFHTAT
jgi:broad specificity phosphatase PhoE